MVGANQDVMDSRGNELSDHRKDALPGAAEILELRVARIENGLRGERAFLVEIQKCLVRRIVGEEPGGDAHRSWSYPAPVMRPQTKGLPVGQRFGSRPVAVGEYPAPSG